MGAADGTHKSFWKDLAGVAFCQGFIDAGGIRTRYLSTGSSDKPLLLLLHGTGGLAECFTRNLESHGEHFWTVAIDMIGSGWTDKPEGNYEIPDYASHVIKVIQALGRERAHISGVSLGGWVGAHMAIHTPHWVDRLVLNTTGGWTAHPEVMEKIKVLSMQAVNEPTTEMMRQRLEFLMFDKATVTDDLTEVRRSVYAEPGYADIMERILCLQDMEIRRRNMITAEQFASITAPTLVLWTSHDPTATPEEGKQISEMIPNARFEVMSECGHWPQFENPETFNRIQLDFLTAA